MKGPVALHHLRTIFAILIAMSLTFAPITSAWAALQMRASMDSEVATAVVDDAMSDCMKAMRSNGQGNAQTRDKNCPCCDAPSKSTCPDVGACLAKCSVHVIAVLTPSKESRRPTIIRHDRPAEPEEPPDWSFAPPAPPPRV